MDKLKVSLRDFFNFYAKNKDRIISYSYKNPKRNLSDSGYYEVTLIRNKPRSVLDNDLVR